MSWKNTDPRNADPTTRDIVIVGPVTGAPTRPFEATTGVVNEGSLRVHIPLSGPRIFAPHNPWPKGWLWIEAPQEFIVLYAQEPLEWGSPTFDQDLGRMTWGDTLIKDQSPEEAVRNTFELMATLPVPFVVVMNTQDPSSLWVGNASKAHTLLWPLDNERIRHEALERIGFIRRLERDPEGDQGPTVFVEDDDDDQEEP